MPALSTSENQFNLPICRSIGTMGLQPSICPPFDIPNSFKTASLLLGKCFLKVVNFFFSVNTETDFPGQQLYVESPICDVSNKY